MCLPVISSVKGIYLASISLLILFCCRPIIKDDVTCIKIEQGRHPVIDSLLGEGEQYVPNDTNLQVSPTFHKKAGRKRDTTFHWG